MGLIHKQQIRIACIGGANVDRKARTIEKTRLYTSNPVTVSESSGGVARNVAENLSRLGCRPEMFTCVGEDKEGFWLRSDMELDGIDTAGVVTTKGGRTGTYTALLDNDGEMIVAMADMAIYDEMTESWLERRWPRIESCDAVFADTNLPAPTLRYAIERCAAEGRLLAIDPVSSAKAAKLPPRLDGVELLFPNREEAEALTGLPARTPEECRAVCERLRERGARRVVLTLGEEGVYYSEPDAFGSLPPYPAEVADVTGAGDALTAATLFALLQGATLADACRYGLAAASLTVRTTDTVCRTLRFEQLESIVKGRPT
ncbi:carbohydrate kinase family protein [Paenibacillus sp.]|uniref:carbohydrate kinase family protein n=1 Tax=Paenibacillus sp. TaxID=58172 RepID=UPI002D504447|nr:carbohydrate kinase family protein [Paenibacillus sp.]HZG85504.1 carbohydrate kinase family protein [Paenibacillus sp.]